MNSQLAIVAVVDVEAALETGSLAGNVYSVDNNRVNGSSGQGTGCLTTVVVGCQVMNWLVGPIDWTKPEMSVSVKGVGGEAVEKGILIPQLFDSPELGGGFGYWWGANAEATVPGVYGYTLTLNIANQLNLDWELRLDVRPGFTMEPAAKAAAGLAVANSLMKRAVADGTINDSRNFLQAFRRRLG